MSRTRRHRLPCLIGAAVAGVLALGGCSGPVEVPATELDPGQQAACEALVGELPDRLEDIGEEGLARVEVDPGDAPAAAYGDPAVVVTCGVARPPAYDRFAECQEINGVGWFVPEDQIGDEPVEVTLTAVGYRPRVQVVVPAEYWPMGTPSVTAALAGPVEDRVTLVDRCR